MVYPPFLQLRIVAAIVAHDEMLYRGRRCGR